MATVDMTNMRWYSLSVHSNFEKRVEAEIKKAAKQKNLQNDIEQVLVPTEEVLELRNNRRITRERRFLPGYILVRMKMTDAAYHMINSLHRVTGFLGTTGKPSALPDDEVNDIIKRATQGTKPPVWIQYLPGEEVDVTEGPLEGFSGMVEEVDEEAVRLKVTVSIFGRETLVDLNFSQVSKKS